MDHSAKTDRFKLEKIQKGNIRGTLTIPYKSSLPSKTPIK